MASVNDDLAFLRNALGWVVLSSMIALGLWLASSYFRSEMKQEFEAEQGRFRAISQRYLSVDTEERIIREIYPRFISLYENGVIGNERRLDWLESVRSSKEDAQLLELDLRMESQALINPEYAWPSGGFDLRGSRMFLDMGLLHEGDLLNFFSQVNRRSPGLFSIAACKLSRLTPAFDTKVVQNNLRAECELTWYTLGLRGGQELTL